MTKKLIDVTRPVVTRSGRAARIICANRKGANLYPIVALVTVDGDEEIEAFTASGECLAGQTDELGRDLVNVPRTGWVNLYQTPTGAHTGFKVFDSKTEAENARLDNEDADWINAVEIPLEKQED